MTRLEQDTRLTGADGHFQANLHPQWQVWFPNGGYMAAMLLRAIGQTSKFDTPLSFCCHFLSVPKLGEVNIEVVSIKKTRNAESLTFNMTQSGKPIIQGMAWTGQRVTGYVHDELQMPSVPHYAELIPTSEMEGAYNPQSFWAHMEQRPVAGNVHWLMSEQTEAIQQDWLRFASADLDDSAFLSAGRYLVILDSFGWPAAARRHVGDARFIAPTLALSVDFHRIYRDHWMLLDCHAPLSEAGYLKVQNSLWSEDGRCLATGMATLMCRPRPGQ